MTMAVWLGLGGVGMEEVVQVVRKICPEFQVWKNLAEYQVGQFPV